MGAIHAYFDNIRAVLAEVEQTQSGKLEAGARMVAEATLSGHNLFAFGASHAGLVTLELYYRTGGMATINPVRAPGLMLDVDPATMTSQMERLPRYGRVIIDAMPLGSDDVIILHSVSGRNPVIVDMAIRAREKDAKVIVLTNMRTTTAMSSRHPSGKNLYELADLVLDNCGSLGDASLKIEGVPEKVAPTSTVIGAMMLNAMVAEAIRLVARAGGVPPVFVSANLDQGDDHNEKMLKAYRDHIFYMG